MRDASLLFLSVIIDLFNMLGMGNKSKSRLPLFEGPDSDYRYAQDYAVVTLPRGRTVSIKLFIHFISKILPQMLRSHGKSSFYTFSEIQTIMRCADKQYVVKPEGGLFIGKQIYFIEK